jgi:hypothetical protein
MGAGDAARLAKAGRRDLLLVCGECVRRAEGGTATARALKAAAGEAGRPVRVVRTACLGLCPKRAVAVASGATLARGRLAVVAGPEAAARAVDLLWPRAPALTDVMDRAAGSDAVSPARGESAT